MTVFLDYKKCFYQKLKQHKARYSQEIIKITPKKSPSSLSDSTNKKSNVTEQNPKLNV